MKKRELESVEGFQSEGFEDEQTRLLLQSHIRAGQRIAKDVEG